MRVQLLLLLAVLVIQLAVFSEAAKKKVRKGVRTPIYYRDTDGDGILDKDDDDDDNDGLNDDEDPDDDNDGVPDVEDHDDDVDDDDYHDGL